MSRRFGIVTAFWLASGSLWAAQLPTSLSESDAGRSIEVLGFGALNRSLLPAEPLGTEPGIRVGIVQSVIVTHDLKSMGAGNGSVPEVVPVPSIHLAKGLPWGLDVEFAMVPGRVLNFVESYGGSIGWTFLSERDLPVALSVRPHFNYTELFSGDVSSWNWGADVTLSKDYVTWVPYAQAGFAMTQGCVREGLVSPGVSNCQGRPALVGAIGIKINLALTFVFQLDTHNLDPALSTFIGKDF